MRHLGFLVISLLLALLFYFKVEAVSIASNEVIDVNSDKAVGEDFELAKESSGEVSEVEYSSDNNYDKDANSESVKKSFEESSKKSKRDNDSFIWFIIIIYFFILMPMWSSSKRRRH